MPPVTPFAPPGWATTGNPTSPPAPTWVYPYHQHVTEEDPLRPTYDPNFGPHSSRHKHNGSTTHQRNVNLFQLVFLMCPNLFSPTATHEPLVSYLMMFIILLQLQCICCLLGFCYFGQCTLSFTACCFSGTWIRIGKAKGGSPEVAEAVADSLKKDSLKAANKKDLDGKSTKRNAKK